MEIIIGKTAGFCFGVENAVTGVKNILNENNGKKYCLGELIHNEQVVESLEKSGMITVENLEDIPSGENVIFRAHGEAEKVYELANERNLNIYDFTCPKVKAIHIKVQKRKRKIFYNNYWKEKIILK